MGKLLGSVCKEVCAPREGVRKALGKEVGPVVWQLFIIIAMSKRRT